MNATRYLDRVWLVSSIVGITIGGAMWIAGEHDAAKVAWAVTTVIGGIPLVVDVVRSIARREPSVDFIALLAIIVSLWLDEYLAGAVIALMLSTGQALESYADRRAHRELSSLLERAPQLVHRYEDGELHTRPIDQVVLGDLLFVKTGEVVPVDGVLEGDAVLDESALTGESRPVERPRGDLVRSGALNAGAGFDLHATSTAADSTYAGIVRLVEEAERQKAPAVRLADRYALIFVPVTLVIAGVAWAISGDPIRLLSVLVVATPC
ncbi:MAG TPA: heavy metal translocating P-type ATPase, partial [Actinomycetota bacterium]|nr:heavy metal translocating P-type ATPase [Actinomycetota bacterium]